MIFSKEYIKCETFINRCRLYCNCDNLKINALLAYQESVDNDYDADLFLKMLEAGLSSTDAYMAFIIAKL